MSTSLRAFKGITLFSLLPLVAACTEATSYPEKLERPVQVQRVTFQSEDASRESSVSCGHPTKPISAFAS